MKHQTETGVRSMVYQYGTVPARVAPVIGEESALAQMKLARRLWNVLVAIDRTRREGYRRIMHDDAQERIGELRQRQDALVTERKRRWQQARARAATPDIDSELTAIRAQLGVLINFQKDTKKERHDARREQLDRLNERASARRKRARQAAASLGLYWGTYNAVMQSADTGASKGELHFRSFRGEGTVTAQIMGGASVGDCVEGSHTFFQVDAPTLGLKWRYARIRIGSSGRTP